MRSFAAAIGLLALPACAGILATPHEGVELFLTALPASISDPESDALLRTTTFAGDGLEATADAAPEPLRNAVAILSHPLQAHPKAGEDGIWLLHNWLWRVDWPQTAAVPALQELRKAMDAEAAAEFAQSELEDEQAASVTSALDLLQSIPHALALCTLAVGLLGLGFLRDPVSGPR
jgi:hypothetical protein